MGSAEDDVLLACLVIVARHHGLPATPDSLSAGLPLTEQGFTAGSLAACGKDRRAEQPASKTCAQRYSR